MSALSLRLALPRTLPTATRSFTSVTRRMAEGDTGATRSGGAASSDAFSKREAADESMYIRRQEQEKLAALKKKIADGEAEIAKHRKEAEKLGKQK
nr:hypothetical protein B0A51_04728 [Rachicladosporium sp. CCFEE 5018]